MMNPFLLTLSALWFLTSVCSGQIRNAKEETARISGLCGMCESTIETAGSVKRVARVDWNQETRVATLTYNPAKTSRDEILKRIALAGYDNESYLAPDAAYSALPGCCQYEREFKNALATTNISARDTNELPDPHQGHHAQATQAPNDMPQALQPVFDAYFAIKDALVQTNGAEASAKGKALLSALEVVNMGKLDNDVHMEWMKQETHLKSDAKDIADTQDVVTQRAAFAHLSENMYALMKLAKPDSPVYYQHCPMYGDKGANWLSKESAIRNPYFGSMMLTCGKTVETIQ